MIARKCDRCGKYFEGVGRVQTVLGAEGFDGGHVVPSLILVGKLIGDNDPSAGLTHDAWDLCEDCLKDFMKFIKKGKEALE